MDVLTNRTLPALNDCACSVLYCWTLRSGALRPCLGGHDRGGGVRAADRSQLPALLPLQRKATRLFQVLHAGTKFQDSKASVVPQG
jgi:hypothetical protein